ncbi:MAG: hypothetical protein JWN25_1038, partial [Verrucomicrobiales bacterium]|nr:hypothetical protein [Verrucomicrobiales bacterium]
MSVVVTPLASLADVVKKTVFTAPVHDIHTHLYEPAFGDLLLWGIDDLLTYHYLVAEFFRFSRISYESFWKLDKVTQADLIWNELFVKRSPLSEACRGVITTLQKLGLDPNEENLASIRSWFASQKPAHHVEIFLKLDGLVSVFMNNSPFDPAERSV